MEIFTIKVTTDTFEQCKKNKLFFIKTIERILDETGYPRIDYLENIDTDFFLKVAQFKKIHGII